MDRVVLVYLPENIQRKGLRGDVVGVVLKQAPRHKPYSVKLIVLPLNALRKLRSQARSCA